MKPGLQEVLPLVAESLSHLRQDLGLPDAGLVDASTPVLATGSGLDSMAVVHLIVDLEARLQSAFGRDWILADERALSRHRSPFRTVGDLAAYIIESTPDP